jgi:curved DNA-binding protein CbpA
MAKDLYSVLEIAPQASDREIRAAYRTLAKKLHPDAGEGSSAEKFRAIQDAYEVLSDPEKRRAYDKARYHVAAARSWPGIPETRLNSRASHIDLRNLAGQRRGEPIRFTAGAQRDRRTRPVDPLSEIQVLFRLFDDFFF